MGERLLSAEEVEEEVTELDRTYPDSHYYLNFKTPIDLLVTAILSAQTHDTVTNSVTPMLFKKYKTADDYASLNQDSFAKEIGRVSFPAAKSKNIISACKIIRDVYGGKVPNKMDELVELPGIGRKTANTILINAYHIVEGIPVDTWVIKLGYRLGMTREKKPEKIEKYLMERVQKRYWNKITYIFKIHGRAICKSVPLCSKCPINDICPKNGVIKRL